MEFKSRVNKVIGCTECRMHALCMYCLGLVPRPKPKKEKMMIPHSEFKTLDLKDEAIMEDFLNDLREYGI